MMKNFGSADSHFYSSIVCEPHNQKQIVFMHVVSIHQIQNIQNTSAVARIDWEEHGRREVMRLLCVC